MKLNIPPIRLLLYYLVGMAFFGSLSWTLLDPIKLVWQVVNYIMIYGSMYAVGFVYFKLRPTQPKPRYEDRIITSLILFLLFSSDVAIWTFPLVGAVTELIQRVIRVPSGPVFNPAAMGALIVSLTGQLPLWWGTNFAPRFVLPGIKEGFSITLIFTILIAGYVAWKYKKLPAAIALMVTSAISYFVLFQYSPLFLLLDGTLAFFALVMAIEPKTTPVLRNEQIAFGVGLGLLLVIFLKTYFLEPYAGSLVIMNGLFQVYKYWKLKRSRLVAPAAVPSTTPTNQTVPPSPQTQVTP